MTFRGYARDRCVTSEAVSETVRSRHISTIACEDGSRRIDRTVAVTEWIANSRPGLDPRQHDTYGRPSWMTSEENAFIAWLDKEMEELLVSSQWKNFRI